MFVVSDPSRTINSIFLAKPILQGPFNHTYKPTICIFLLIAHPAASMRLADAFSRSPIHPHSPLPPRPTRICAHPPAAMPSTSAIERKQELDGISARLATKFSDVPHLSPDAVSTLQCEGTPVVLIDTRTPEERAVSTIPGSLTIDEFNAREGDLKGARCVAFCTVGYRSSQLAQELQKRGFDAANLEGSILAWVSDLICLER